MTAIVTLANVGRAGHVAKQADLVPRGVDHIVVALGDENEARAVKNYVPGSQLIAAGEANLALARNAGAREAIRRGHDELIFLDADCLAGEGLVDKYCGALAALPDAVVAGPVTYLPQGELRTHNPKPHPARPNPADGELVGADDYNLFWSLSFALTAATWARIEETFGGFDTAFAGYGGEDTDFAWNLRTHDFDFYWVGGAHAYHQWHPVSSPPWEHLDDILRNAAVFHRKWGTWPMEGWLREFEAAGAIEFVDNAWRRSPQT